MSTCSQCNIECPEELCVDCTCTSCGNPTPYLSRGPCSDHKDRLQLLSEVLLPDTLCEECFSEFYCTDHSNGMFEGNCLYCVLCGDQDEVVNHTAHGISSIAIDLMDLAELEMKCGVPMYTPGDGEWRKSTFNRREVNNNLERVYQQHYIAFGSITHCPSK